MNFAVSKKQLLVNKTEENTERTAPEPLPCFLSLVCVRLKLEQHVELGAGLGVLPECLQVTSSREITAP